MDWENLDNKKQRIRQRRCCGKISLAMLLSVGLLFGGCGQQTEETAAPELLEPVDTAADTAFAEYREIYQMTSYESSVIPYLEELSFEKSGTLNEFCVNIGDTVKTGDLLAVLDDSSAEENCERLQAQLATMQENNAYNNRLAEIAIETARLSGEDTTRRELQLRQARELQALEEEYLLENIKAAEEELGANQILAPFDGTVVALSGEVSAGNAVSEGSAVLTLAEESSAYLTTTYISEAVINACSRYYAIVHGKEYELTYLPYDPEELAALNLNGITPVSTFALTTDEEIAMGDYAMVCLIQDYRERTLTVPMGALYTERGQNYVYIAEGTSRIKTPVEIGVKGTMYVEILEGLEEGACVYVKN